MRAAWLTALAACLACHATARPEPPEVSAVSSRAQKDGRIIIMEFSAEWCGPCKVFKANVLPRPEVQAALTDVEFVVYMDETAVGRRTRKRYGVRAFPTILAADPSGRVIRTLRGAADVSGFLEFITQAQVQGLSRAVVEARLEHNRSPRTLMIAGRWYLYRAQRERGLELLREASAAGDPLVAQMADFHAIAASQRGGTRRALAEAMADHVQRHPRGPLLVRATRLALLSKALDSARSRALAELTFDRYGARAEALNGLVYLFLASGELDVALRAATRQVELAPDDPNAHDSLAEVHHYRGERDRALAEADRAIDGARDAVTRHAFEQNRARFAGGGRAPSPDVIAQEQAIAPELRAIGVR